MIWIQYRSNLIPGPVIVTIKYNTTKEAQTSLRVLGVTEFELLCGFPAGDFHTDQPLSPCKNVAVDKAEFTIEGRGTLVVPVCEGCYYRALKLYPRDVVELVTNPDQLYGEWK